jgi:hypothetical protein
MTAEVLIMNKHAVAIAADSAATRNIYGYPKIANTANKLFRLSKKSSVGILLYNNSRINDIPFELLVKDFRAEHLDCDFNELSEYAESFLDYLGNCKINTKEIESNYVKNVVEFMVSDIYSISQQYFQENNIVDSSEIIIKMKIFLENRLHSIREKPLYEGVHGTLITNIDKEYSDFIPKNLSMDEQIAELLKTICLESLYRDVSLLPCSGVVITGFGKNNYFPSYFHYHLFGILCGQALYKKIDDKEINHLLPACIAPFAQRDVVDSFITGINTKIEYAICEKIPQSEQVDVVQIIQAEKAKNIADTMQIVEDLSISDLAQMAKSLVEMTSFKRKVSSDVGTVGGPIDVAVISKGDGFVWVERKHYFKKELNEFFFQGYQER